MSWKFGKKRVHLDATKYGLDEDGWLDIRTRVTAKDYELWISEQKILFALMPGFILDWSLKIDGEEIPYSAEDANDLPVEMLSAALEGLSESPLAVGALGLPTGLNGSTGTTPELTQDKSQGQKKSKRR